MARNRTLRTIRERGARSQDGRSQSLARSRLHRSPLVPEERSLVKRDGPTVLVYRAGFLGDVVMSIAAVSSVRRSDEMATLVYASWPMSHPLLEKHPLIDYVVPTGAYRLSDFDHLVDIRHEDHPDWPKMDRYWGELHFDQVKQAMPWVQAPDDFRPSLYIELEDHESIERDSERPLVVFNSWSKNGVNWRLWPAECWVDLAQRFTEAGWVVVQIGGPGDPRIPSEHVLHVLGLPLRQSVGLLTKASLVIGIDSFIMHVCHARIYVGDQLLSDGVPGLLLAGPIPPACVIPVGSPVKAIDAALLHCPDRIACGHSFSTEELPICEHKNVCMQALSPDEVWEKVRAEWMS